MSGHAQKRPLTRNFVHRAHPLDLRQYERAGGYQALRKALTGMSPTEVTAAITASKLRGRGGAGYPTGTKWSLVPMGEHVARPKYFVCNADEMEPGTFKDRVLMEGDPHQLIEGIILSSYAIQADVAYIFIRNEYKESARRLAKAIGEAYEARYLGKGIMGSSYGLEMRLHISAGRYICGEVTSMLNAMEGKRAIPRSKPPHPTDYGLWGRPTLVNNVETICNVPHIVANGPEWFKSLGATQDSGTKIYGVSGRVKKPGVWELPIGSTVRQIIEEQAEGMREGLVFRGILPGGASTEFLVAEQIDTKLDFEAVGKAGSRMGTGCMIVLDDKICPVAMVLNVERFFARESCGWCTPCRDGLPWIVEILSAIEEGKGEPADMDLLDWHCDMIRLGHTFCALAPGAIEPLHSALKYFREDFMQHIKKGRCPWK